MGATNFDIVDAAGGYKVNGVTVIDENGNFVGGETGDIESLTMGIGLLGGGGSGAITAARGFQVRNEIGGTLVKGTLIRLSGYSAAHSRPLIAKADSDVAGGQATHILAADLENNTNGDAYGVVLVTGIDTDAVAAVGDPLYLSDTAGQFTAVAPAGSDRFVQKVGIVTVKHASTGAAIFFPEISAPSVIGRNELQGGVVTPGKMSSVGNLTATADGTGSGSSNQDSFRFNVTSNNATDQISLPQLSANSQPLTYYVGANGFELITPAGSNTTINGTDADGTNQADIPANSLARLTPAGTGWILEIIGSTGTVAAAVVPDND